MLRTMRILAAVAVFAALNLFFFGFVEGLGFLADIQFVPACLAFNVVVVCVLAGVTFVGGRLYCSVVCPLGVFQDIALWLRRRVREKSFDYRPGRPVVRAASALTFAALFALGGASLACLVEPYGAYGRIATHLFEPLASACVNWLADLLMRWGHPCMLKSEMFVRGWAALGVAGASFVALAIAAAMRGRLFCNIVCPVGAVLGLLSAKALVKVRLDAKKCVKCGLCAKVCKAECIDVANGKIDQSRCVRCFDCLGTCRKGALAWR